MINTKPKAHEFNSRPNSLPLSHLMQNIRDAYQQWEDGLLTDLDLLGVLELRLTEAKCDRLRGDR
jgi:hypothetical protein